MGQSASTARDPRNTGNPAHLTPSSSERDPGTRDENMNNRQPSEYSRDGGHPIGVETREYENTGPAVSQPHEPSEAWQQPRRFSYGLQQMRSIEEEGSSEYGLAENEYRSAALARMAARRQSAMSRLGSRILPNSVIRGLLNSQEETPAEGRAHRHGLVSRTPPRSETAHSSSRFSPFSSLGSRGITRRRTSRTPYVRPSRADPSNLTHSATDSFIDSTASQLPESNRASWRRLQRMRQSLSMPISHMFGHSQSDVSGLHEPSFPSPTGASFVDDSTSAMDTQLDFGEPLPEPELGEPRTSHGGSSPSHQTNAALPGARRLPELLRARSARALRRDDQTPLSRVLQLAAAAIAAQLSGSHGPALPNIQALGNEGLDGSLQNFIQSLQQATSSRAQPTPSSEGQNQANQEGPPPPVNFLRVFRFANADSPRGTSDSLGQGSTNSESPNGSGDGMSVDEPAGGGAEGRTVTLVVVGVRSVPLGGTNQGEQGPALPGGAGLDALLGLPFLPPNVIPRPQGSAGNVAQRADGSSRMQPPRLAGVPGLLRQPGTNASRRLSDAGPLPTFPIFPPSAMPESPPGPHPPPSTPAEQGRSAVSSGTSTPSRRPSSASAMSPAFVPDLHEAHRMQPTSEPAEESTPPSAARQRRRSDSEFARHRAFGSGSVRRNGVVEPDQPPPSGGRSWLIYVVGTNLAENHPALTTPSLFTDNPTYEDMILLSSLLGPVKPPVATQDDLNSAGGLFRLVEYSGSLVAEALDGADTVQMQDGERCLICLSDYEVAEEIRQLAKCEHVFHKDCIDQWLTTGRNSCPLCRGQGVHETSNNEDPPAAEAAPASSEATAV